MHRIRAAVPSDAETIAGVHVTCWRETYAGLMPDGLLAALSVESQRDLWRSILADPAAFADTAAFVALDPDGEVVGYAACNRQSLPDLIAEGFKGEFQSVYLLGRVQRRGLGRRLMAAMARDMRKRGLEGASLFTPRNHIPALNFYEELGGEMLGERQVRDGDFVVTKATIGWRSFEPLLAGTDEES